MIKLPINGKEETIPTMDEMTVNQYIEFTKTDMNLINYLSVCMGVNYKEAFNSKIKNTDKLLRRLGQLKDYTKIKPVKRLIIDNELIFIKNIEISTVGQRFMIEENSTGMQNEEFLCFILAVGIVSDPMNIDEINKMKSKLMNEPYINVLPYGFFLANRFLIGKKNAMNFFRWLKALIKMKD